MPLEPALKAMLTQTIQHSAYTGQDAYGKPTHAAPTTQPARVQFEVQSIPSQGGQERSSQTVVYVDSDFAVGIRDKIVLPDGTAPAIQAIDHVPDPERANVIHHRKLLL